MASSRLWIGIFIACSLLLGGCAGSSNVPDDARLIYSGRPITFASLNGPPKTGTLYVYDDSLEKVVKVIMAAEPQSDFQVVNAANGHDIHVYWEK